MKPTILLFLFFSFSTTLFSQQITGCWEGEMSTGGRDYRYKLYIKQLDKYNYLGVSEAKRSGRKVIKRMIIGHFIDTLYNNTRIFATKDFSFSEFAPLPGQSDDFVPQSFYLDVEDVQGTLSMKPALKRSLYLFDLKKTTDVFPEEYLALFPKGEAFTVTRVKYVNAKKDGIIGIEEEGRIQFNVKHNFPITHPFRIRFSFSFPTPYMRSGYIGEKYTIGNSELQMNIGDIQSGYGITVDSVPMDIHISIEDNGYFETKTSLPARPWVRAESIHLPASAVTHSTPLSSYYGTNNMSWGPVFKKLDSLVLKKDSIAMMYQGIFEYMGAGGYIPNKDAGMIKMNNAYNYVFKLGMKGNAEALYLLFYATEIIYGLKPDLYGRIPYTLFFLDVAAKGGVLQAKYDLAVIHLTRGDSIRHKQCVEELIDCYNKGMKKSATTLGVLYETGLGTSKNIAQAMDWYRKGMAFGDPQAMLRMAIVHYKEGPEKNTATALQLVKKAARLNDNNAIIILANLYLSGAGGVDKNINEAMNLFKRSADNGYKEGMEALAILYTGEQYSNLKDDKLAVSWTEKGAESGSAVCMAILSKMYSKGVLLQENALKARSWYNLAVENGISNKISSSNFIDDLLVQSLMSFNFKGTLYSHQNSLGLTQTMVGGTMPDIIGPMINFLTNGMTSMQLPVNNIELLYKKGNKEVYGAILGSTLNTEIPINENDLVIIRASGKMSIGLFSTIGPEGTSERSTDQRNYASSFRHGAVMVEIGPRYYYVGAKRSLSNVSGQLSIIVNDRDVQNNSGAFDINVEVIRGN